MTHSIDQLRALLARQHAQTEAERSRLAQDIHSTLAQGLTVLCLELSLLEHAVADLEATAPRGELRGKVRELSTVSHGLVDWVRRTMTELRPRILDEFGLTAAITWWSDQVQRRTGIPCPCVVLPEEVAVPPAAATDLFRSYEGILANAIRHARANRVLTRVEVRPGELVMSVEDDGCGIAPAAVTDPRALGLGEIRERAYRWGGEVEIVGVAGQGTTVSVRVPLPVVSRLTPKASGTG